METVRLTTAQAIVRWMMVQRTRMADGSEAPMFPGIFGIFGHGNVTCLGHALEEVKDEFPTWRGQNEQGMALAAVAYNKAVKGRQIMAATSSIGPGATNMVTAAGVASSNRLPLLLFAGDTFLSRIPDPVLQQVENFNDPSTTVNDSFRAVTKYWDRITHPAQVVQSLPAALATMLDPATRGPAFIGLPQDVQAMAYDYPARFFESMVHEVPRPRPDSSELMAAVEILGEARKPLIIAGGGVHYSVAEATLAEFATQHRIPVVETVAGKSSLLGDDPNYVGPIGVTGCEAANNLAAEADVVLAIGCRLQDFTTGSWTVFKNEDTTFIGLNTTRFDAVKHRSLPVVGDARETLREMTEHLGDWAAPESWMERAGQEKQGFIDYLDQLTAVTSQDGGPETLTYAQVIRAVNSQANEDDVCLSAAGGLPGEVNNGWWSKGIGTFDSEYGYSCMGYEISGGWGASMAHSAMGRSESGDLYVFVGDGSYLMMNSDLYSSVLSGHKMTVLVCDNGGFAVINRLQIGQGGKPFNNLLADCRLAGDVFEVDFAAHAAAMGCAAETVSTHDELQAALGRARASDRTYVIAMKVGAYSWTEGGSFWQVGVPEVSNLQSVRDARAEMDKGQADQRVGW
ncbi:MAG: 3D-(3,5/4)-trihydroxycyclohexane-1,2-dione acylhydrolase (decyclizing) [Acidimicrobiia bacterium]|nr:3D-(3,5/4)-trihydroxycyclohexane-1,2-dione acylhydrolase (decyclizing) [Acidimicrobiia bacterium]